MFSLRKPLAWLALVAMGAVAVSAAAQNKSAEERYPGVGRNATGKEVLAWDIDVRPDFKGLPAGSGSVQKGMDVWEAKCASCHGVFAESNEFFSPLVGGTTADDIKTGHVARLKDPAFPGRTTMMKVATVSTLWDYINRAMPWNAPKSLSTEEVYAVTAYLLNLGGVIPEDFTLSDKNIAEVQQKLPNRNGMTTQHALWPGNEFSKTAKPDVQVVACMSNCGPAPKVRSTLPEHASNNHGNLAQQNRLVGAQRGIETDGGASKAAKPAAEKRPVRPRYPRRLHCWRKAPAWPAMAWSKSSLARLSARLAKSMSVRLITWRVRSRPEAPVSGARRPCRPSPTSVTRMPS